MNALSSRRHVMGPGLSLGVILLVSLIAPLVAPYDPFHAQPEIQYSLPSVAHPLGTDSLGRDVLSRTLYGGRQTLLVAALATGLTLLPGLVVGLVAGYAGGFVERGLMSLMDAMLAFPSLLLALASLAILGSGPWQTAFAVGIAGLPSYARVARATVLEVRHKPFIEAAYALGSRPRHILLHHVLPNTAPALIAFGAVTLSWAILNTAALTFLGFGGDPSIPDWGGMLLEGRRFFRVAPWIAVAPGLAISLTIYSVNALANALRPGQNS